MEERTLVTGGFYKHFKNKLYQVRDIAYHSETKEKYVVYQALYGDFKVYIRPYDMFMSEVDHVKYPDVTQKYRFEQVELNSEDKTQIEKSVDEVKQSDESQSFIQKDNTCEAAKVKESESKVDSTDNQEFTIDPRLERFLDADSYEEKLKVLQELKVNLDDKLIDTMAVSLDIEVPKGSIDARYASLVNCIRTHAKYEGTRLR